ncbi:MAG: hypothetical protein QXU13_02075 [Desulfurococcaceae archaeon]
MSKRYEHGHDKRSESHRLTRHVEGRGDPGQIYAKEHRLMPQPLGDICNPLCPLFSCGRNALFVLNKHVRGRMIRVAQCRLTGGDCIAGNCQYAVCKLNSLLPDGKCAKALEKRVKPTSDEELFRQMKNFEEYDIYDFTR